jgi:hypothetical protein
MRVRVRAVLGLAALLTASCGGVTDPSKNQLETWSSTVAPGGTSEVKTFNVSNTGEFTIIVTQLAPVSNAVLGSIFGQATGGSCAPIQQNNFTVLNSVALSGSIIKGNYCVVVYDVGTLAAPENFTMTISHP